MRTKHPPLLALVFSFLLTAVSAFLLLFTSSCKNGKESNNKTVWPDSALAAPLKMPCLILDSNTFNFWKSKGWTTPGDPKFTKLLLLQFYTEHANTIKESMTLAGYPAKNMETAGQRPVVILTPDSTCVSLNVPGKAFFANNTLDIASLNLFKPNGERDKFDFLRFKPKINAEGYISFDVEIVRVNPDRTYTVTATSGTNPCPPCQYCNPPCTPEL